MRIGIDLRVCSDHFPGIGRATYSLVRAMSELAHGHELILLHNPRLTNRRFDLPALARVADAELIDVPLSVFAPANQWRVPRLARRLRLDLLHTPYYVAPYFRLPCPSILTIYDSIGRRFPQYLSRRGRLFFELTTRLATRSATHILTGSESARRDLAQLYRVPNNQISVTPFGVEPRFVPQPPAAVAALRQRYHLPERYVLYLGTAKPHKNLERLVRGWERVSEEHAGLVAGWKLVLAGHHDHQYEALKQFIAERQIREVCFLPDVAEDDLPVLYSGAGIFAFVSFYEGFGLPPLEAMACGAPTLCSYASSLPEVVGEAALTVDPFSFIDIAAGLGQLLRNEPLRRRLSLAGQSRARSFSWRRTAELTFMAYRRALTRNA